MNSKESYRSLHFHQLEVHLPMLWRCVHPFDNLAEDEERDWKTDRFVMQHLSNHREGNFDHVAIHRYFAEKKKEHLAESQELLEAVTTSIKPEDVLILSRYVFNADFPHFLFSIRDNDESEKSWRFFTGDIRVQDDIVLPQKPRNPESVLLEIENAWSATETTHPTSSSV